MADRNKGGVGARFCGRIGRRHPALEARGKRWVDHEGRDGCAMSEAWKLWEGQRVEGNVVLRQYLGGSEHSAVYLTERDGHGTQKAAIKFISKSATNAEWQLARWREAAGLNHPHLLQLYQVGQWRTGDAEFLYAVMEHAEEDLSQILPVRALTVEETKEMLGPVVEALQYLHGRGFVHGRIKPSNILATEDRLKLSIDSVSLEAESLKNFRGVTAYTAPEASLAGANAAGDVWSLGATLAEVLTQQVPRWERGQEVSRIAPMPEPFATIVRNALRVDPARRWTIGDIARQVNPAEAAKLAPMAAIEVPLSPVMAVPRAKREESRGSGGKYIVGIAVAAVVIAMVALAPKILRNKEESPQAAAQVLPAPAAKVSVPAPAKKMEATAAAPEKKPDESQKESQAMMTKAAAPTDPVAAKQVVAREAVEKVNEGAAAPAGAPKSSVGTHGEVLDQVLPNVSEKARATIQGKVRVGVKVHVGAAGNVSEAELESAGPSRFFSDLALEAARKWEFSAPEVDGKSAESVWVLRFEFTSAGTRVAPAQVEP